MTGTQMVALLLPWPHTATSDLLALAIALPVVFLLTIVGLHNWRTGRWPKRRRERRRR